jgi:arylformamidase
MPFWTGSTPFHRERTHELAKGDVVNESRLSMGCHNGTHIDAPSHFEKDGFDAERVPLENLVGRARVVYFPKADFIDRPHLEDLQWKGVERVLFRTRNSEHWSTGKPFDEKQVYLTGPAAQFLVEKRVRLIGTDGLGIEQFGHTTHPAHHAILGAGITLVEGLYLVGVPPGDYYFFCGPLRIVGSDGAPARALLMDHLR